MAAVALVGSFVACTQYVINREGLREQAQASFDDAAASLARYMQSSLSSTFRQRNMLISALEAMGDAVSVQQFRDQASTLVAANTLIRDITLVRCLTNLTERLEWQDRMSQAFGEPIEIHNARGDIIPYDNATRQYFAVETTNRHDRDYLRLVLGFDLSSEPGRAMAVSRALQVKVGVTSPPFTPISAPNDTAVMAVRALRWRPETNASIASKAAQSAPMNASYRLMGMPIAADMFADGRPTAEFRNDNADGWQRVTGTIISGSSLMDVLIGRAKVSGWIGDELGAVTFEDLTDVPDPVFQNLTVPTIIFDDVLRLPWPDLIRRLTRRGIPFTAGALDDTGTFRRAEFNATAALHYSGEGGAAVSSYLLGLGGRRIVMVFSSRHDYLVGKMQPATVTLITGLISTFVTAALLGVIILSAHTGWWHSVHRRDQQLAIIRDRQDMQERMTSFLSHELRNPSHIISRSAEHLMEELGPQHPCRVDIEAIIDSAETMHRLVNDVVSHVAVTQQRVEIKNSVFDIRAFVQRLARSHRSFANVPLTFEVDPAVPASVITDSMRLQQIASNGLTNAARFTATGDIKIHVSVLDPSTALQRCPSLRQLQKQHGASLPPCTVLELRIMDTGSGLSGDQDQDTLFVPFVTLTKRSSATVVPHTPSRPLEEARSSSYAARVRGSGLGLPVSKMLASLLEGDLKLFRDKLANRTVFSLALPIVPQRLWPALCAEWQRQTAGALATAGAAAVAVSISGAASTSDSMQTPLQDIVGSVAELTAATVPSLFQPPPPSPPSPPASSSSNPQAGGFAPTVRAPDASASPLLRPGPAGMSSVVFTPTIRAASPAAHYGLHVLAVDDERLNRQVLARMLTRLGCTFELCEDGDDAEVALRRAGNLPPATPMSDSPTAATAILPSTVPSTEWDTPSVSALGSIDVVRAVHVTDTEAVTGVPDGASSVRASPAASSAPVPAGRKFDVVLMDVVMRRQCGQDTARSLRQQGMMTPIFAATGNQPGPEYADIFDGVLLKPFTQENLAAVLEPLSRSLPHVRAAFLH